MNHETTMKKKTKIQSTGKGFQSPRDTITIKGHTYSLGFGYTVTTNQ